MRWNAEATLLFPRAAAGAHGVRRRLGGAPRAARDEGGGSLSPRQHLGMRGRDALNPQTTSIFLQQGRRACRETITTAAESNLIKLGGEPRMPPPCTPLKRRPRKNHKPRELCKPNDNLIVEFVRSSKKLKDKIKLRGKRRKEGS
ncbi:hypothetical protein GW17_00050496 [Ensete ventricosum]|nr:hypothetical protein GW17_00050496 [Ensete ventricosum]